MHSTVTYSGYISEVGGGGGYFVQVQGTIFVKFATSQVVHRFENLGAKTKRITICDLRTDLYLMDMVVTMQLIQFSVNFVF